MPTISINRKVFEELVAKKLPEDKLKERISFLGTGLEAVTKDEIEVEIFPNRPDMLSVQGFARAFSSFIGQKKGLRKYEVKPSGEKVVIDKSLKNVRPYTACAIVKGIDYTDERIKEIIQIQEKLHITYGRNRRKLAIGIYPFEKIRPPIRFMAKKPEDIVFRPLEFPREINARQILSQHPTGREYGHLLEGLDRYPVFIDADNNVLSVPPIINSHDTGKINESTKDVFVECSGFDLDVLKRCLNMVVCAMADMGGKICSMELAYPDGVKVTPDLEPIKMAFDIGYINRILGLELKEADVRALLERMGFGYEKGYALVPCYRADILHPIDLVEDIAIAYGYENFTAQIPNVATVGKENPFEIFRNKVADILAGLGLLQANTYNLANDEHQQRLMGTKVETVTLANALSKEYDVLRAWVLPSLMDCLKNNRQHDYPHRLFAIGEVFMKGDTDTGVAEKTRLASVLCSERADYTEIRQVLDYLFRTIDVEYSIVEAEHDSFIPGRVGRVIVNGNKVAYIGEISPAVIRNWGLDMPVSAFELNLSDLYAAIRG